VAEKRGLRFALLPEEIHQGAIRLCVAIAELDIANKGSGYKVNGQGIRLGSRERKDGGNCCQRERICSCCGCEGGVHHGGAHDNAVSSSARKQVRQSLKAAGGRRGMQRHWATSVALGQQRDSILFFG
jgi:hypothetical protein